jgi:hypothetical protein
MNAFDAPTSKAPSRTRIRVVTKGIPDFAIEGQPPTIFQTWRWLFLQCQFVFTVAVLDYE